MYYRKVMIGTGNSTITSEAIYSTDGNRLEKTKDALGKETQYGYNADTNILEWVQYPEDTPDTRTEYTYDNVYRLATVAADIDADTTLTASYTYNNDLLYRLTTGSTTYFFSYNGLRQRTSISIGTRNLANYTYTDDQNHYLSQLVYGNQDMVQYTYDNLGRVILETYEDGSTVAYAYDNTGALATVTDSETGIKTTYYYDLTDRLMKYVEKGTNYSHSVQYDYDVQNNLTKLVETINGVDHTTEYTYDKDNRVTGMNSNGVAHTVIYDDFGRVSGTAITSPNITKSFYYRTNSSQLKELRVSFGRTVHAWSYTYDDNGNILSAYDDKDGESYTYTYDSANQLTSAFSGVTTWEWTYDDSGNILTRKEYTGPTLVDTITYSYTDSSWGDLLTAYDGTTIQYDAIGNPVNYGDWYLFWKHGRQLEAMVGSNLISFTYDANGMRKTKDVDGTTYTYLYNGSQLTQMTRSDGNTLFFTYDTLGHPSAVNWNGTVYYIITNLQGDVTSIRTSTGAICVQYLYDPWGRLISTTGPMATTLGTLNPLTYRGYVYDHETGLYYLQSRYYNPEWGRFINADALVATGQGMLDNNIFAYCNNNPVTRYDRNGRSYSVVCFGDKDPFTAMLMGLGGGGGSIGSAIITLEVIALVATLADTPDRAMPISFDEADASNNPPSPNDDDDDDLWDDDYYNDDSNFAGREKIGKSKGNSPGNNRAQNQQFNDATKRLSKDQKQKVHYEITGEGYGYHDIVAAANDLIVFIMVCLGLEE